MRSLTTMIILFLTAPCVAYTQANGKITGKVIDEKNKEPLDGATVSVMNDKTGLFIKHAVSNKKGEFSIGGLPNIEDILVIISFTGYRDTSAIFDLTTPKKTINTGQWKLKEGSSDDLEEVVVTAKKPPFVVKKDTVEFNASAFKSLPNDMVQDLLRKIPGMIVDEQGGITVNGRKVSKIKVDGRDFFEGDLKTALENLPGVSVDKVQVYETREKGDRFRSVIEPINKDLTLNLKLKKDYRKGVFGNVTAQAGTEDRYGGNVFLNTFNEDKRATIMASTGNAAEGRMAMHGGGGGMAMGAMSMMGSGGGILKNSTGLGFNINNKIGKATLDANYMYNRDNRSNVSITDRINILPDSTFLYNSNAGNNSINNNHSLHLRYTRETDTLSSLRIVPTITFGNNLQEAITSSASTKTNGETINSQQNNSTTNNKPFSIRNEINYTISSRDKKTNLDMRWNFGYNTANGVLKNINENVFFNSGSSIKDSLNQSGKTLNNGFSNDLSVNIQRFVSKKISTILTYNFTQNNGTYDKDVYNFNDISDKHDILDSLFSIHNKNVNISHQPGASIGYTGKKLTAELGAGLRFTNQENKIVWKDSTIKVQQQNFTPRLTMSYATSKHSRIMVNYTVESQQPQSEQLAPVQDNTNPLYLKVGNPFLKTAITHQLNSNFMYHSPDFKWNIGFTAHGAVTSNQIVDDSYYDENARQISTYRNVNGAKNINVRIDMSSMLRFNKLSLMLHAAPGINYSNSVGFVNKQENKTSELEFSPTVGVNVQYDTKFSLFMNMSLNASNTMYSLDGIQDIRNDSKNLMVFAKWNPVKRLSINSSVFHTYNSQLPAEFQRGRTIVNSGVNYSFLKNERLIAGVSVNDIFNQNISVMRNVTVNAIQTVQTNALRRYGMFTLTYRLNKVGPGGFRHMMF